MKRRANIMHKIYIPFIIVITMTTSAFSTWFIIKTVNKAEKEQLQSQITSLEKGINDAVKEKEKLESDIVILKKNMSGTVKDREEITKKLTPASEKSNKISSIDLSNLQHHVEIVMNKSIMSQNHSPANVEITLEKILLNTGDTMTLEFTIWNKYNNQNLNSRIIANESFLTDNLGNKYTLNNINGFHNIESGTKTKHYLSFIGLPKKETRKLKAKIVSNNNYHGTLKLSPFSIVLPEN